MTEIAKAGLVHVEANYGRWVAYCGWPIRCDAAVQLQRFQPGFICPECGGATDVMWPSVDMTLGIERLLLMRPHRKNQNWLPGETLPDLLHENDAHGITVMHVGELGPGAVFGIEGDHITIDALPVLNPRRELVQ